MIKSFKCKETEKIFKAKFSKKSAAEEKYNAAKKALDEAQREMNERE